MLSRSYAARTGDFVDSNQEMVGLGAANLAAGLLQGFPISASSSRTPVAEAAGARTQLAGLVGALAVAALLIGAPGLLADLPKAALAVVVIASALGLIETAELRRIRRIQRWEFWLSTPARRLPSSARFPASDWRSSSPSPSSCGTPGGRTTPSSATSTASRAITT